eukprot:4634754-Prymnesium_polylepis.1
MCGCIPMLHIESGRRSALPRPWSAVVARGADRAHGRESSTCSPRTRSAQCDCVCCQVYDWSVQLPNCVLMAALYGTRRGGR